MVGVSLYSYSIEKINFNLYKHFGIIAIIVLMAATYLFFRFYFKRKFNLENLLYIITIELLVMGNVAQIGHGVGNYWELYGGREIIKEHQTIINDLNKEDPTFYRIFADLADRNNNNLSISLGFKGISTFHSIYSFELFEFLNDWSKIPYSYSNWSMGVDEKRIALDSFLNVKYYILPNDDTNIPFGFSKYRVYPNYTVYKYDYHVELGYSFDTIISRQDFNIYYDYFQHEFYYNQLAVVANEDFDEIKNLTNQQLQIADLNQFLPFRQFSLTGSNNEILLRGESTPITVNEDVYFAGNYLPQERNNNFYGPFEAQGLPGDKISINLSGNICENAQTNNMCQVVLKLNYGPNIKVSFYNNNNLITQDSHGVSFFDKSGDQKFARSFYLNTPADKIELEFLGDAPTEQFTKNGIAFYYQYQDTFLENQQKLIDNKLLNIDHSNNNISFETNYQTDRIIVLSVPYDKGWHLEINGEDSKIFKLNSGFIGLVAKAGNNSYRLSYTTPGLNLGGLISLAGLILFLLLFLLDNLLLIKRKKDD